LAGDPAVAICSISIAFTYSLLICCVVFTALHTQNPDRRKAAMKVLKILTGFIASIEKAKAPGDADNSSSGGAAS
jgi:cytochrome c556